MVGGGDVVLPWEGVTLCLRLPYRFMLVRNGMLVKLYLLAMDACN